ncbi:hypothetical protein CYPRO_3031 [Cyclonatronum proteinivorum]|uniref:Uncharacterized protein n=1 Tax=Cyclonatronum proteinivorum TaxID=1457365 RepID=A0A345UP66_9BACT|nr:hypothetical protein CYPRO_3031 [Cyclonatronum proteinivorum]
MRAVHSKKRIGGIGLQFAINRNCADISNTYNWGGPGYAGSPFVFYEL